MRKLYIALLLSISISIFKTDPLLADINDGLILYYSFNADQGSFVSDESQNNHDGAIYGAIYTDKGRLGGAYHFDGVDDYILAGDLGYHETGAITFWMNADAVENWRNPFSTNYAGWDDNIRFEENSAGYFSGGGHGLGRGDIFTHTLMPKRWYHVAYVWDQNYVYGYLDGELIFKNPHPDPNSLVHPDLPLTAGEYKQNTLNFRNVAIGNGYSTDPDRYWKGLVDEVRIYERPLSAADVLTLYRGKDDGLVLYYSFDTNDGATVRDDSASGHTGSVLGPAYSTQGKNGGAYLFDGIDDKILIPRSNMLNVAGKLTFSAWYKVFDTNQGPIIEYNDGTASGAHMWVNVIGYQWQGKGTGANLVDIYGNDVDHVISTDNLPINQWHNLAVTYDADTGIAAVYLDGLLAQEKDLGSFTPQTSFDIYIGNRPQGPSFHGLLDDIRIYNRVLSAKEIRQLSDALSHGITYQNFEPGNGSDPYGWPIIQGVTAELSSEQAHSGTQSWKFTIPPGLPGGALGGTAVASQIQRWHTDFQNKRHDHISFWIWADPSNGAPNTVALKFFDHNKYVYDPAQGKDGFWVWTTKAAEVRNWTELYVLFTQLPSDFNFNDVDKIEFYNYWDGQYYLDDIAVTGNDRVYQKFEPWSCPSSNPGECAWAWNGTVEIATDAPQEGTQSLKLNTVLNFGGTGMKSQEKRCDSPDTCAAQDFWHVDLSPQAIDPMQHDRLTFWVKEYAQNGLSNNVAVKFFDHSNYFGSGAEIWTKQNAEYGEWNRLSVPFSSLPADFDIRNINKLEILTYWPGTYYFDDIRSIKADAPVIEKTYLSSGTVTWKHMPGAARYTLQQSTGGANGPWATIYSGIENICTLTRLNSSWLRLRWETAGSVNEGTVPYYSDYSDTVVYEPTPALIRKHDLLNYGIVEWSFIPQSGIYEVQEGASKFGPWNTIYKGTYVVPPPIAATLGKWYRVRAIRQNSRNKTVEAGQWSPAILYDPNAFIKTDSTALRLKGTGPVISLRGVNLGNLFLIEPWMFFGSNSPLILDFPDHYTINETLKSRLDIGPEEAVALNKLYHQAYLQEEDLNNLMRMGVNFVRLPLYYEDIRPLDSSGQWATDSFDFSAADRVVKYCADRGIYVLLDLHGAPGSQSKEMHSGRMNFNKLFDPADDTYRQRTVELWQALAQHYKNDTTVVGYDILNEPFGAITPEYYPQITDGYQALWNLYERLYNVIRLPESQGGAADTNHVIIMEGIPSADEWATLPDPIDFGWTNIAYQFHYYGFNYDENGNIIGTKSYQEHVEFLNDKIAHSRQGLYRVPVMIGECNGFNDAAIWELLLTTFNAQGWSWCPWSYKIRDYPSEWGLYNHSLYAQGLPDFNNDTLSQLQSKLNDYDTVNHHTPNTSLIRYVDKHARLPGYIHDLSATRARGSVKLTWSAPYTPTTITAYRIYYGTTSSGSFDQVYLDNALPGATIKGLRRGVEYRFRVEAVNSAGTGPLSNIATATPY